MNITVKFLLTAAIASAALTACGPSTAIPQDTATSKVSTSTSAKAPTVKVSACDKVREAFLTGTTVQQTAALKALKADKTAPANAREYADYWLTRDAQDADMRDMDKGIIQMACATG